MHKAKIIEAVKLSDGEVAILARCCGDPSTDSWHTITVVPGTDMDSHKLLHLQRVEGQHILMSNISLEALIDE